MIRNNLSYFGSLPDGTPVEKIDLRNEKFFCSVITYGGALQSLSVPDKDGKPLDILLGFDSLEDYRRQPYYCGAIIGRCANRIGGAEFRLNDQSYRLAANENANHLHGGERGFDKRLWKVYNLTEDAVTIFLFSPDGQEGYPGNLSVWASYRLRDTSLIIDYRAKSDADTICNLTNHAYFNLYGHASGPVNHQRIQLFADSFTPVNESGIPTGAVVPVEGTLFDLRQSCEIGEKISDEILKPTGGFDHNWVVNLNAQQHPPVSLCSTSPLEREARGMGCSLHLYPLSRGSKLPQEVSGGATPNSALRTPHCCATAYSQKSGITMEVLTTAPGVQFYTGNYLSGNLKGKGGAVYAKHHGFCLETQGFPDAPHHADFPSVVLKAGEIYHSQTIYQFSIKKPNQ